MAFHLTYYRFGVKYEETYDTLNEAVCSAAGGSEFGLFAYVGVRDDDGANVLDKPALSQAVADKFEEWDRAQPHASKILPQS